jgi:VanZ family protein
MNSPTQAASESPFFKSKTDQYFDFCAYFEMAIQLIILLTHSRIPQKFLFSIRLIFGWAPVLVLPDRGN